MTLPEHAALWNRIQQFAFDDPYATITFSRKLAEKQKWSPVFTDRVIEEYRRFIFLCCISPKGASPSQAVDEAWHLHLTYTQSYWNAFCKNTLGKDIHHYPSTGGRQEDHKHATWYADTLNLYETVFGTRPPADIWPPAKQQQLPIPEQSWQIRKELLITIASLLLLPFLISFGTTGKIIPFFISDPQFLFFYALLAIAATSSQYLIRKEKAAFFKQFIIGYFPADVSVFQLAHFLSGKHRAMQVAIVDLVRRNLLEIKENEIMNVHNSTYVAPATEQNPLAPALLAEPDNSTVSYDTISVNWYKQDAFVQPALERLSLLFVEPKKAFVLNHLIVIITALIGLVRVMQGLHNDRPVQFLLFELGILAIANYFIELKYSKKQSLFDIANELMIEKASNGVLHTDDLVADFALNGREVLNGFAGAIILSSVFAPFAPSAYSGTGDWSADSAGSGSSNSCSSDSSCGGGGGCGGCGSSD